MGSTMHAHIEVKKDGKWLHFGAPDVQRDYLVFAVMTGERLDSISEKEKKSVKPVAKIHKMPKDVSEVTKFCYEQDKEGYALRNITVLTADDLWEVQKQLNRLEEEMIAVDGPYDLEADIFHTYINGKALTSHQGWDDLRVIAWFDN